MERKARAGGTSHGEVQWARQAPTLQARRCCRTNLPAPDMSNSPARSLLFPGVPLALASAVLFGASAPLSKLLLGSVNPWLLAGLLYLG
eukprot:gene7452-9941_t